MSQWEIVRMCETVHSGKYIQDSRENREWKSEESTPTKKLRWRANTETTNYSWSMRHWGKWKMNATFMWTLTTLKENGWHSFQFSCSSRGWGGLFLYQGCLICCIHSNPSYIACCLNLSLSSCPVKQTPDTRYCRLAIKCMKKGHVKLNKVQKRRGAWDQKAF